MATIEQQNVYGGQGLVQFTLYPSDDVPPFTQVQRCVIQASGSIGRHCTPKLNRLLIGIMGGGILKVNDSEVLLEPNVVQAISSEQSVAFINTSDEIGLSFWIIQVETASTT